MIVPRTCTEISAGNEDQHQEKESRPLEAFRDTPAYVLLGDPGAGKTTAFETECEALGEKAYVITARDFLTFDPQYHSEWHDKTLFIDGLDEIRVGANDVRTPFNQIRGRLDGPAPIVDVAKAVVEEAQRADPRAREQEIAPPVPDSPIHHREPMIPVLEEERQVEHLPFWYPAREHGRARDGHVHRADLDLLEGHALAAELSRRKDDDPEAPAGALEHEVPEALRQEVELRVRREHVGEADLPGGWAVPNCVAGICGLGATAGRQQERCPQRQQSSTRRNAEATPNPRQARAPAPRYSFRRAEAPPTHPRSSALRR